MSALSYLRESVAPMVTQRAASSWSGTFFVSRCSPFSFGRRGAGPTPVTFPGSSPGLTSAWTVGALPGAAPKDSRGRFPPCIARGRVAPAPLGPKGMQVLQ